MDQDSLLQILPERMKKGTDNVGLFITYHFKGHIEKCRQGRSDGDDRYAAEQKDHIQDE
jgi:hypothetical protein